MSLIGVELFIFLAKNLVVKNKLLTFAQNSEDYGYSNGKRQWNDSNAITFGKYVEL